MRLFEALEDAHNRCKSGDRCWCVCHDDYFNAYLWVGTGRYCGKVSPNTESLMVTWALHRKRSDGVEVLFQSEAVVPPDPYISDVAFFSTGWTVARIVSANKFVEVQK